MKSTGIGSVIRRFVSSKLKSITTVHGVNHLYHSQQQHGGGRSLVWWSILLSNVALTTAFLLAIHNNYNTDQIVTKINANCKIDRVPFPSVSICNFNIVSLRETGKITAILKKNKRTDGEIKTFYKNLPYLKDYKYIQDNVSNLMETMAILKQHYYTIDSIMEEVHQKCEDLLLSCTFNRKAFKCRDIFRLMKTFEGYCCMFNFAALTDTYQDHVMFGERKTELEYYIDNDNGEVTNIISTSEFGRSSGLSVLFNVEPSDYPAWSSSTLHYGAKILISDPNDYTETTVLTKLATIGDSLELKVQPMVFESERSLRQVSPQRRACWFHEEVRLAHTDRYSFETCMTECTMAAYRDLCHCLPYKYPTEKTTKLCEFQDMDCLLNITERGMRRLSSCSPPCYTECIDKKYSMNSDSVPLTHADLRAMQLSAAEDAAADLMALRVYYNKDTCTCYTLTLLMDFNYFIATYGGVFSLFFGGSLITIFEIAFIVTSNLASFIKRKFYIRHTYNNYYIP